MILHDLRKNKKDTLFFSKYTKEDIIRYLKNPTAFEKQLRNASIYLYNASSHYKRLIEYFAKLSLLQYIVVPNSQKLDIGDKEKFLTQYKKNIDLIDNMNIKHEFIKVLKVAYREDVFYGYEYSTSESYFIKKFNPDYCQICSIEDGVYNFAFDFSYFDKRKDDLDVYPKEFKKKYEAFKGSPEKGIQGNPDLRWQELPSDKTICIKANEDLDYILPPFVGVFESIYDIQDYKLLKKTRNENDNYKVLTLQIPLDDQGNYQIDEDIATEYFRGMEQALPDGIGLALTPMKVDQFSFQNNSTAERDAVEDATSQLWSSAGVSSLIFNNTSAGSTGLTQSIRADFDVANSIIKQIERWINRKLKNLTGKYKFKIQFLDTNRYNQQEVFDLYLKAGNSGVPVKTALAAILGYSPADTLSMSFLENDILEMRDSMFNKPLLSSSTMSPDKESEEAGAPKQETVEETGQKTRDRDINRDDG